MESHSSVRAQPHLLTLPEAEAEPTSPQTLTQGQGPSLPGKDRFPTPSPRVLLGDGGFTKPCEGYGTLVPVNKRPAVTSPSGTFHI